MKTRNRSQIVSPVTTIISGIRMHLRKIVPVLFLILASFIAVTVPAQQAYPGSADNTPPEPLVTSITIDILNMPGDVSKLAKLAKSLILLREGERFSDSRLHDSLELLKNSKMFRTINVPDPEFEKPEISLTFQLTPFGRIKDIHTSGSFPIFEREILNAMNLYAGDIFNPERLSEQEEAIRNLYTSEGYLDPKVTISVTEDKKDGLHELYVNITKGDFFHVEKVEIEGNRAFSDVRLKMRLKTWHASFLFGGAARFIQKELDKDMKNLTSFYRKKGFADVEVTSDIRKDLRSREAIIRFMVREGPKYHIAFSGNKKFWTRTLKKDLGLFEKGNIGGLGLKRSIKNIKDRYRKAGYLKFHVTAEKDDGKKEDSAESRRNIRIVIDEGPRSVVEDVTITGNKAVPEELIKKQLLTRTPGFLADGEFVPKVLEADRKAIKTLYLKHGYMHPLIEDEVKWRKDEETGNRFASLIIKIKEGTKTLVSSVSFTGLTVLTETGAREAIALKEGEPLREYMLLSDENTLSAMISEKGYPHARVTGKVIPGDDGSKAEIVFNVEEGSAVKMGEVLFTGNFRTREKTLRNAVSVETGEPFSLKQAAASNKNLRGINALNAVEVDLLGLKEKTGEIDMLVTVEEKKPYYLQFGLGYDSAKEFFLHSRLGDRNLFGRNLDGWISGELSGIGHRGEIGITEPSLLGSTISSTLNLYTEDREGLNQNFGSKSYGSALLFNRRFVKPRQMSAQLGFQYEHREQYRVDDSPIPTGEEDQYEPRSFFVVSPSLVYNSTDSFVRPKKGLYSSVAVDISKGVEKALDDFLKYRAEARYYYSPLERITFAVRGRYGKIAPFDSEGAVPDDRLFFLGGTADVRGFDENKLRFDEFDDPVGGRTEILGSLEVRFDLGNNLEIITFSDMGAIKNSRLGTGSDDFRSSIGIGLGYITPIGPIGLVYGHKLERKELESAGRIHFTIGYTF